MSSLPLLRNIGLVSISKHVKLDELTIVAAAIQQQVTAHFGPIWKVDATVSAFPTLKDVPDNNDQWYVVIADDIGEGSASGIHKEKNGKAFAYVVGSSVQSQWTLPLSHECLEMLVDPCGTYTVPCGSPTNANDQVRILVEVSDPSQSPQFAYYINNVMVSDFYTPNYFDSIPSSGVKYSHSGKITRPLEVLPGGYLSWVDSAGNWWQQTWFKGDAPVVASLGKLPPKNGSFRFQIDRKTGKKPNAHMKFEPNKLPKSAGTSISRRRTAATRAQELQECLSDLMKRHKQSLAKKMKSSRSRSVRIR